MRTCERDLENSVQNGQFQEQRIAREEGEENTGCFGLESGSSQSKRPPVGTILSSVNVGCGIDDFSADSCIGNRSRNAFGSAGFSLFVCGLSWCQFKLRGPDQEKSNFNGYNMTSFGNWLISSVR